MFVSGAGGLAAVLLAACSKQSATSTTPSLRSAVVDLTFIPNGLKGTIAGEPVNIRTVQTFPQGYGQIEAKTVATGSFDDDGLQMAWSVVSPLASKQTETAMLTGGIAGSDTTLNGVFHQDSRFFFAGANVCRQCRQPGRDRPDQAGNVPVHWTPGRHRHIRGRSVLAAGLVCAQSRRRFDGYRPSGRRAGELENAWRRPALVGTFNGPVLLLAVIVGAAGTFAVGVPHG